jgi:hypothetical protein
MSELPTRLPDNPAGRRCMDVIYSLAKKFCDIGNKATGDFVQSHFPAAKTIGKEYADGKLKRTIECEDGSHIIVIYDYKEKTVAVEQ